MKINIFDLFEIYENDVVKNLKNKRKIFEFEKNKVNYIVSIKNVLENSNYNGGSYKIFLIHDPKTRVIMSQSVFDKIINHYVAKKILEPNLEKYLCPENCATRKNMGTSYAVKKLKEDINKYKKKGKFYYLKLDLAKYFYSIDHEVLKSLLIDKLNKEEYNLVCKIIDSTNYKYINNEIEKFENKKGINLPKYNFGKGLPIGSQTSQILAIFYLYKIHHFIKHNLKIKRFTTYMTITYYYMKTKITCMK